ncbi:hypothetical protein [Streptomyces atratus]
MACGPSGLVVVDCDVAKGPDQLKDTLYAELHKTLGPLVSTGTTW